MIEPLSQLWPHSPIHAWVLHGGSFYCHVQGECMILVQKNPSDKICN